MTTLVRTELQKRAILTPVKRHPRLETISIYNSIGEVDLKGIERADIVALDFETQGTDVSAPDFRAVGVGLSWHERSLYINLTKLSHKDKRELLIFLSKLPLIGHNITFDAGVMLREVGTFGNWQYCTYGLYKQLSSEGFPGQQWGLKVAQRDLLGWYETNEVDLDRWLVNHLYVKGNGYSKDKNNNRIQNQQDNKWYRADKSEMWRAPPEILGKYCALDADATWQLFKFVLQPALRELPPQLIKYHQRDFMDSVRILLQQQRSGITIDKEMVAKYNKELVARIEEARSRFMNHEEVKPSIDFYNEIMELEHLHKEPNHITKKGTQSKNWDKWQIKYKCILDRDPDFTFNINSGLQLIWLYYEWLGHKPPFFTDTGQPATSEKALKFLGDSGRTLVSYNTLIKEQGYVHACLEHLRLDSQGHDRLHPQFKCPGTLTGRLAGAGGLNVQQIPKTQGYLECWYPTVPGKVWIDCYSEDTEILTESGWKTFDKITKEDKVWKVDPKTQLGKWTKPKVIMWKDYEGDMYSFGNLLVTPNHKMVWYDGHQEYLKESRAVDHPMHALYIPSVTLNKSDDFCNEEMSIMEIWQALMIQADGSKCKDGASDTYQFEFSKERKIRRAIELFGTNKMCNTGRGTKSWHRVNFISSLLDSDTKTLNLHYLEIDYAPIVVDALIFWDGSKRTNIQVVRYSSTDIRNIDEVTAYLSRAGYKCTARTYYRKTKHKPLHYVDISTITTRKVTKKKTIYKGKIGCVNVDNGYVLVRRNGDTFVSGNCDHSALEQVVLAELSRDPTLLTLYGPDAKENDVYLFVGSNLPGLSDSIRSTGYDPDNPTPEGIRSAKQGAKKARSTAKLIQLASSYGAGAQKIMLTLGLQGINISLEEAQELHKKYWELFAGVKEFERDLVREYKDHRGWVLNGIGRPICVWEGLQKDIVNRVIQSTGHDLHMTYIGIIEHLRKRRRLDFSWVISDFHDQCIVECNEKDKEEVYDLIGREAYDILNSELEGLIPLKGDPQYIANMADAKCG